MAFIWDELILICSETSEGPCKWSFSWKAVYEREDHFPLAIRISCVWFRRDIFRATFRMLPAFKFSLIYFRKYINVNSSMCE